MCLWTLAWVGLSENEAGGGSCVGGLILSVIGSGSLGVRRGGVDGPLVDDAEEMR